MSQSNDSHTRQTTKVKVFATLFLAGMMLLNIMMAWNARPLVAKGYPDFTIFYGAAKMVREGLGHSLYNPQLQFQVQREFAPGVSIRQGALPYNHPPFETLLFVPFTWLSYSWAYLAWLTTNLLILLLIVWLLRSKVDSLKQASPWWCWFALATYFPIFVALLQGQDAIVLVLLLSLVFLALRNENDFLAGCCLGLGLFRFHLILPLLFMLLWQKRARAFLGFSVVAALLAVISAAIVGGRELWHYPGYVWFIERTMGHGAIVPSDMPNLRGTISVLLGRNSDLLVVLVVGVLSLALVLFVAEAWKRQRAAQLGMGFSAALIATVLVSYHAFAYDLSLLIIPVFLVLNDWQQRPLPAGRFRKIAILAPVGILFLTPIYMLLWLRAGQLNLLSLVLLLWLWGVSRQMQRADRSPQAGAQALKT